MADLNGQALDDEAIRAIYRRVSNWGRWGGEDEAGTLNFITQERRVAAARLVREGHAVSCAFPVATLPTPTNILPAQHTFSAAGDVAPKKGPGYTFDSIGISMHGPSQTHIDALCHTCHDGLMYNGKPVQLVTSSGAKVHAITTAVDGIISRGVLLDLAAARDVAFIEPEEPVRVEDFERAERMAGVEVGEGDILIYRVGRQERRAAKGPYSERLGSDGKTYLTGLYPDCLEWLHDRKVALLGSDCVHDLLPAPFIEERFPIHVGTEVYMGLQLLHNLRLDALSVACKNRSRYEFFMSVQPLHITGGTASPINPIAVF